MTVFDVTICVSTCNGEGVIRDCLSSVAAQDLDGVEVLVVDDCSDDATVAIARHFENDIRGLRIVTNTDRVGPVGNMNRGIELARGRWIKPLLQADILAPGCLAAVRAARRRRPIVVCGQEHHAGADPDGPGAQWCELVEGLGASSAESPALGSSVSSRSLADLAARAVTDDWSALQAIARPTALLFERSAVRRPQGFDDNLSDLWGVELLLRLGLRRGVTVVDAPLVRCRTPLDDEGIPDPAEPDPRSGGTARLRLVTAFAVNAEFAEVRRAATRREPPLDLTAVVRGASPAASDVEQAPDTAVVHEPSSEVPQGSDCVGGDGVVRRAAAAVRFSESWGHMIGPLVAVAYLQVGWRGVETRDAIVRTGALVASAAALAAYAHIINDTFDIRSDRLAGKPNRMAQFSARTRAGLIACAAVAGSVPWFFISLPTPAAVFFAAIYVAPWIYSAPPVRLKEHEVGGPVTDAANAFVLPSLFTIALFAPLGPAAGPEALMVISTLCWSAGRGVRSILIHQITDAANDRASGTWTLIARIGPERATRLMHRWLFPVEVVGQLGLLATVWFWSPGLVLVAIGWGVTFNGARLAGVLDRRLATTRINEGWNLYWWQIWPALGLSVAIALDDASGLALTALVVVLFASRWLEAARTFAEIMEGQARRLYSRLR